MRLKAGLLAVLLVSSGSASALTTVTRTTILNYDGVAYLSDQLGGPEAGYTQAFEIALLNGASPTWAITKETGYILTGPDDSDLSLEIEDCFVANSFCGIGAISGDGLTFAGRLTTPLPSEPDQYGFYNSQTPSQLWISAEIKAPASVTYQITKFDPALISSVPDPATWLTMLAGLGAAGFALRRRASTISKAKLLCKKTAAVIYVAIR